MSIQITKPIKKQKPKIDSFIKLPKAIKSKKYIEFLKTKYWNNVRNLILKRDDFKCVCGNNKNLHIHHKTYENHFNEHLHLEDLITLCKNCHEKEHSIN